MVGPEQQSPSGICKESPPVEGGHQLVLRNMVDKRKSPRSLSKIIDQKDPREKKRDGSDLRGEKTRLMQLRLLRRGPHEAGRSGRTPLLLHSRPTSRVVPEESEWTTKGRFRQCSPESSL